MKNLFKRFRKEEEKISDNEAILGNWECDELDINFRVNNFSGGGYVGLFEGKYSLWRGLIVWSNIDFGGMRHDIFKQNVNYQFKGDKLLLTFNDKSYEFKKVTK